MHICWQLNMTNTFKRIIFFTAAYKAVSFLKLQLNISISKTLQFSLLMVLKL